MGYKLGYASTYKVEYTGSYFNYDVEGVMDVLNELGIPYFETDNDYSLTTFEIYKNDIKETIKNIKNKTPAKKIGKTEITYGDFIEFLNNALEYSDKDNSYVHFAWRLKS